MGKNKLSKFADMESFENVFQYPFSRLQEEGFPLKGKWAKEYFKNDNPIVLELGCGKGEYAVGLAKLFPHKNFIGLDIKGARMWTGAKEAAESNMTNVAFIRSHIELVKSFFEKGEVAEIWITFPDPQMKKQNKRMTSTRFMRLYLDILSTDNCIHLKTDSPFMYQYTKEMVALNQLNILNNTDDLYNDPVFKDNDILNIKTFYEQQWIARGKDIKYLTWTVVSKEQWVEPDIEIDKDDYRSFGRTRRLQDYNCD